MLKNLLLKLFLLVFTFFTSYLLLVKQSKGDIFFTFPSIEITDKYNVIIVITIVQKILYKE
ncbi:hypothetical protein SDC9_161374 [bioreactor metagenome]|uniref:Uncharacterized protein n=1 Tax=bioreactor metagenome TaxID=1076179 RepID=A0A645FI18_9ZZZZ